jgi:hypothetical protein
VSSLGIFQTVLEHEDQKKARPASRLGLSFYPATDLVNGTNQIVADTADNDQGWYGPKYQYWHIRPSLQPPHCSKHYAAVVYDRPSVTLPVQSWRSDCFPLPSKRQREIRGGLRRGPLRVPKATSGRRQSAARAQARAQDAVRRDRAEVADFLQRGFCDRRRGDAQEALRNAVEGIVSKNV